MDIAIGIVALAVTVLVVAGGCRRLGLSSPLVLIVVGIAASYVPFIPDVELTSEVVLLGLLPPLLYSASQQTSLIDFNANRIPILLLAVVLVGITTGVVAVVVHWLVPALPWWAAFAIGAVVGPPDAVAATSIGRRIGLPRRVTTMLEGESLFNDATALVALNTAIGAATASVSLLGIGLDFAVAAGVGVVVGLAIYALVGRVRRHITDPVLDSGLSFVVPFASYLISEELHGSGVVAVVVAGLLLGHRAPVLQTARSRIQERTNWQSISFLLESAVFLLIGLQAYRIVDGALNGDLGLGRIGIVCVAALVTVVVVRMAWVFIARLALQRSPDPEGKRLTYGATTLLGWAGMRGVVTLAAAFVIPPDTPSRDLLQLIAFFVTAGTLLLQGLTLPPLARWLKVEGPSAAADALAKANLLQQASQAGMSSLKDLHESGDQYGVKAQIKERLERRNFAAWESVGAKDEDTPTEIYARVRQEMIDAEREKVLEVRSSGTVPHEVVTSVLSMLDVEESMLEYGERERDRVRAAEISVVGEGGCEHLRDDTGHVAPDTPGECAECLDEGLAWVHLRMCCTCGHVACCDSSPGRHATRHYHSTGHPVMRSAEPGEDWRFCFVDQVTG
ncbi:Na+/H+ antiporter [Marmoricola endophyticus]|uniref:Na+/H+ antiporter n=1 Tax=Marmoricola endophyticus TaxID=2040280 RepID=UPI00166ABF8D|nr:Na+/H+ antiporter [Marmoricola endophyticus]